MEAYRAEEAPVIVEATGFTLVDETGKSYIDGHSSLWCNVHGHRVPEIDAAIVGQLGRVAHSTLLGCGNGPSAELAHELVQRAPTGLKKVFFSDNGATALEVALKLAWQYHRQKPQPDQRNLFVRLSQAYHGDTVGTMSLGGISTFHHQYAGLLFETLELPSPSAHLAPPGMTGEEYVLHAFAEAKRLVNQHADRIAAIVVEPLVQAAAGIWVHPPGYLKLLRELATSAGTLLIADEVAVGFARMGSLFACEQEAVSPDLMCLSKGLTGGYLPLGATLTTDAIYDAFLGAPSAGRTFFHGHTYTGNQLGCTAALASLRLLEANKVLENVQALSHTLKSWQPLCEHPHVGPIRTRGTLLGFDLFADAAAKTPFPVGLRMGHQVTKACRQRGLIIRNIGDTIIVYPAPAMPNELLCAILQIVAESTLDVLRNASR